MARLWLWGAVAPLLAACGGAVASNPDSSGGKSAAGGASGGMSAGGASGDMSAGAGGCVDQGKTYADGAQFPADDGCNTCYCTRGFVGCTLLACAHGCEYGGQSYQLGQTFEIDCNTCTCQPNGSVICTERQCADTCASFAEQYAAVLAEAKRCDPGRTDQCTATAASDFGCGCSTPVNAYKGSERAQLSELAKQPETGCIEACPECEFVTPGTCTMQGSCEFVPFGPGNRACQVGGVLYPNGASAIQDPFSCNVCLCVNGELNGCTTANCPIPCPSGTNEGTQCVQCGSTADACQVIETACLPTCTDSCVGGQCVDGLCRQVCN